MVYYSQNGYTVLSGHDACRIYYADNAKFYLRPDDCGYVLAHFARKFDDEVEALNRSDCHGFSRRQISGTSEWSNHSSGTAVDLNATQHQYGGQHTFTNIELINLRDLMQHYDGVLRWGGDYRYTKDEMHFEINRGYEAVSLVAQRLRKNNTVSLNRLKPGKRNIDVYMVKRTLRARGYSVGTYNKYFGLALKEGYSDWQRHLGYTGAGADGIPGRTSLEKLGFKVVA
jgi:hypothetical protein